jgi:transposase
MEPLPKNNGRGKQAKRTGHNLLLRLKNYREAVLRFMMDPQVPFTNNQAEQDIRMMKCKQKISGGFRTLLGAEQFARIRGFLSTAKKQGWNVMAVIRKALLGEDFIFS